MSIRDDRLNCRGSNSLSDYAWYGDSKGTTHPVGMKKPNAWGLYDMHGNVWEWCQDWQGNYLDEKVIAPTDNSFGSDRVNRGGSWFSDAQRCRSAHRDYNPPEFKGNSLGLRVSLVLDE